MENQMTNEDSGITGKLLGRGMNGEWTIGAKG